MCIQYDHDRCALEQECGWCVLTRGHTGELVLKSIMWCAEWRCLDDALAMGQTAAKRKTKTHIIKYTKTLYLSNYATSRDAKLLERPILYMHGIVGSSGQDKLNRFWEGIYHGLGYIFRKHPVAHYLNQKYNMYNYSGGYPGVDQHWLYYRGWPANTGPNTCYGDFGAH